jgi:hypothetical protein
MNHIATGRALSLRGELLPPHHRSQQRWWKWMWSQWRWLRGQFPISAGCRNQDFCPPNFVFDGGGTTKLFRGLILDYLGFLRRRHFISGRAMSEGDQGAHHGLARPGGTRTTRWCGHLGALLRLCFGLCLVSGKIGGWWRVVDRLVGNPKRKVWWAHQQVFPQYETKVYGTSRRKNQLMKVDARCLRDSSRQFIYGALSGA